MEGSSGSGDKNSPGAMFVSNSADPFSSSRHSPCSEVETISRVLFGSIKVQVTVHVAVQLIPASSDKLDFEVSPSFNEAKQKFCKLNISPSPEHQNCPCVHPVCLLLLLPFNIVWQLHCRDSRSDFFLNTHIKLKNKKQSTNVHTNQKANKKMKNVKKVCS